MDQRPPGSNYPTMQALNDSSALASFVPFFVAGFALIATPGPATLTIAATSAAYGTRQGLRVTAGLIASMSLIAALAAAGFAALVLSVPGVVPIASTLAAAYLLYLAWRIATAPVVAEQPDINCAPSFQHGFLLNFVNPKAYAAAGALFGGFVLIADDPLLDAIVKGVCMLSMLITADAMWIVVGRLLARSVKKPHTARLINRAFATALVVSVVAAFVG